MNIDEKYDEKQGVMTATVTLPSEKITSFRYHFAPFTVPSPVGKEEKRGKSALLSTHFTHRGEIKEIRVKRTAPREVQIYLYFKKK